MNDMLGSECSSGCESGWTLYLEHSFLSPYPSHGGNEFDDRRAVHTRSEENQPPKDEDDEEEDLSMVSDASSGPQVFHEDEYYGSADNGCFYHPPIDATLPKNSGKMKKKTRENGHRSGEQEHPSFLDDTASSPFFNLSQKNFALPNNNNNNNNNNQASSMEEILDFSEGCSATHFEGRSAFHGPFGFFQSPLSANQLQQNQWFGGKIGMR